MNNKLSQKDKVNIGFKAFGYALLTITVIVLIVWVAKNNGYEVTTSGIKKSTPITTPATGGNPNPTPQVGDGSTTGGNTVGTGDVVNSTTPSGSTTSTQIIPDPEPVIEDNGMVERDDNRCGADFGNGKCNPGRCCSVWGWCNFAGAGGKCTGSQSAYNGINTTV